MSNFDFTSITTSGIEFGLCHDRKDGEEYHLIPTDIDLKAALREMALTTYRLITEKGEPDPYDPAEKYKTNERLIIPLDDPIVAKLTVLYHKENITTRAGAIKDLQDLAYYFCIYRDRTGNKLIAARRANFFKGVVKARNRLIKILGDDTLSLVDDDVFKLDLDFDFLICDRKVFILHPRGFEYTADLNNHILGRAAESIDELSSRVACIDFDSLKPHVTKYTTAARALAALRSRDDLERVSPDLIKAGCEKWGIEVVVDENGRIAPASGHEQAFLLLLDHRQYTFSLVDGETNAYTATGRTRKGSQQAKNPEE